MIEVVQAFDRAPMAQTGERGEQLRTALLQDAAQQGDGEEGPGA
jgi:hypothetical protein